MEAGRAERAGRRKCDVVGLAEEISGIILSERKGGRVEGWIECRGCEVRGGLGPPGQFEC